MQEYEKIDERLMSGQGLLRIPDEPLYRDLIIYVQTVRRATNRFFNADWTPPKSLVCRVTQRYQGYVCKDNLVEFERAIIRITPDISAQVLEAVNCAYAGTLQSFFNLASCISECLPFNIVNNVEKMVRLDFKPDDLVFNCYSDTAILVQLYALKYQLCGADMTEAPPPPPPPPNQDLLSPGEPIGDISEPYDENDNVTQPFFYDEEIPPPPEDFPIGSDCVEYNITFLWETPIDPPGNTVTVRVYAPIEDVFLRTEADRADVVALAKGRATNNNFCEGDVRETQLIAISGVNPNDVNYELIDIAPA